MEATGDRKQFFISYTGVDSAWAHWAFEVLEEAGYSCAFQEDPAEGAHPGQNFVSWMHENLLLAERVLAILSPAYVSAETGFTTAEWTKAVRDDPTGVKGLLVPLLVEPVEDLGLLGPFKYLDLVGEIPGTDGLSERLVDFVGRAGMAAAPAFPAAGPQPSSVERVKRWILDRRPAGLRWFAANQNVGGFREWLTSTRLPFYSRREHLAATGSNVDVLDEDALLDDLLSSDACGLVIAGRGGHGKTRLSLELAARAVARGWPVVRATPRFQTDQLRELPDHAGDGGRVLIVFDYLEQLASTEELVTEIESLNSDHEMSIRFVGSCRPLHLHSITPYLNTATVLDISPPEATPSAAWESGYRRAAVLRILEHASLRDDPRAADMCGDIPVLAVFACWLFEHARSLELEELLGVKDFAGWVARRMRMVTAIETDTEVETRLARLVAALPLPQSAIDVLRREGLDGLLDQLVADGWVDAYIDDEGPAWAAVHDVLADQMLLHAVAVRPATGPALVESAFDLALECGVPESALLAVRRVIEHADVEALDVGSILVRVVLSDLEAWRPHLPLVLRGPTLDGEKKFEIFAAIPAEWEELVADEAFRKSIGWLSGWIAREKRDGREHAEHEALLGRWLPRALEHPTQRNYVLVQALRMDPDAYREMALQSGRRHARSFLTRYLMYAWLTGGLPPDEIASILTEWLVRYNRALEASFVLSAWCDAEGDLDLVATHVRAWLVAHCSIAGIAQGVYGGAQFVLKSWLANGGDPALVEPFVATWLGVHCVRSDTPLGATSVREDAQFVLKAWFDSKGDFELADPFVRTWLTVHCMPAGGVEGAEGVRESAQFVLRAWLMAGGDVDFAATRLLAWLGLYCIRDQATGDAEHLRKDAPYVIKAWLDAGGDPELVRSHVHDWLRVHCTPLGVSEIAKGVFEDAEYMLKSWLDARGDVAMIRPFVEAWFGTFCSPVGLAGQAQDVREDAQFLFKAWLDATGDADLARPYVRAWVAAHCRLDDPDGVKEEAQFVLKPWLDAKGGLDIVTDALRAWLGAFSMPAGTTKGARRVDEGAGFVISAWLVADCELDQVQPFVEAWLAAHCAPKGATEQAEGVKERARYVLKGWLDSHGDIEIARPYARVWLDTYCAREGSTELAQGVTEGGTYVIKAWLDADGEPAFVAPCVLPWLQTHCAPAGAVEGAQGVVESAQFLFGPWLSNGGDRALARPFIREWLATHCSIVGSTPQAEGVRATAPYVLRPWLVAGGDRELVEPHLMAFLEVHCQPEGASEHARGVRLNAVFVLTAWLDAGGDVDGVERFVTTWLDTHFDVTNDAQKGAEFVINAWVKANGDFALVRDVALAWLHENRDSEEAMFLTKAVSSQHGLPSQAVRDLLHWCRRFSDNPDAVWRLARAYAYLAEPEFALEALETSESILDKFRESDRSVRGILAIGITGVILSLLRNEALGEPALATRVHRLLASWIRDPRSHPLVAVVPWSYQDLTYVRAIRAAVLEGLLDLKADRGAIARVGVWIRRMWSDTGRTEFDEYRRSLRDGADPGADG